jgi:hypothetical protein
MRAKECVILDLGKEISVASSLFLANMAAQELQQKVYFLARQKFSHYAEQFPQIHFLYVEERKYAAILEAAYWVLDFTTPGEGMTLIADHAPNVKRLYIKAHEVLATNLLTLKAEFLEQHLEIDGLLKNIATFSKKDNSVLTYSPETAAHLNMMGVPTIEMCYRFKTPGSFLPGSLVIKGDSFSLMHREDLDLIFHFYKSNKIEDLFVNKSILQVDWDLVYFKADTRNGTVFGKNHPISPMESFMDIFFQGFLIVQPSFTTDQLLAVSQKMDPIDLEATIGFMRKTIKRCLEDVEYECFPFTESYWNFIKPYVDCTSRKSLTPLHRALTRALMGLEMFEKIAQRQRRTLSMH